MKLNHEDELITWRLFRVLATQRRLVVNLTKVELGISSLQLDQAKEELEQLGVPILIEMDPDQGTVWTVPEGFKTHFLLKLNLAQVVSLQFARGLFNLLRGTSIQSELESTFKQLDNLSPIQNHQLLKDLHTGTSLGIYPGVKYSQFQETIKAIEEGIEKNRVIEFRYQSGFDRRQESRKCEPYQIYFFEDNLYLIAKDVTVQKYRWFLIQHLTKVVLSQDNFLRDSAFSMIPIVEERKKGDASDLILVKLKVKGWVRENLLETPIHPSQKTLLNGDGTLDVYLKIPESQELVSWVLSLGSFCQVLSPVTLKFRVEEEARGILEEDVKQHSRLKNS